MKAGGLFLLAALPPGPARRPSPGDIPQWAMVIDLDRCMGCQSCVIACKVENHTAPGRFLTRIIRREVGAPPHLRLVSVPVLCLHCTAPECLPSCPNGAIRRLPGGMVVTDWDRCKGDGSCVGACPHGARFQDPRFGNKADSCDLCLHRLAKGLLPACVEACPSGARVFGDLLHPQGEFLSYLQGLDLPGPGREPKVKSRVLYVSAGKDRVP